MSTISLNILKSYPLNNINYDENKVPKNAKIYGAFTNYLDVDNGVNSYNAVYDANKAVFWTDYVSVGTKANIKNGRLKKEF